MRKKNFCQSAKTLWLFGDEADLWPRKRAVYLAAIITTKPAGCILSQQGPSRRCCSCRSSVCVVTAIMKEARRRRRRVDRSNRRDVSSRRVVSTDASKTTRSKMNSVPPNTELITRFYPFIVVSDNVYRESDGVLACTTGHYRIIQLLYLVGRCRLLPNYCTLLSTGKSFSFGQSSV